MWIATAATASAEPTNKKSHPSRWHFFCRIYLCQLMNINVQKILNIDLQKYARCQKKSADQLALKKPVMVG